MRIIYSYKDVDKSESFETLAEKKVNRMSRLLKKDALVEMFIKKEPRKYEVTTKLDNLGRHFTATARSEDLYKTLDLSISKIKKQLKKAKVDKISASKSFPKYVEEDTNVKEPVKSSSYDETKVPDEKEEEMINKKYGKEKPEEDYGFNK